MKKNIKTIALLIGIFMASVSFAQLTEPGGGDGSNPTDEGIAGGGAPIGSGLALIIGMGVAYGGRKTWKLTQNNND